MDLRHHSGWSMVRLPPLQPRDGASEQGEGDLERGKGGVRYLTSPTIESVPWAECLPAYGVHVALCDGLELRIILEGVPELTFPNADHLQGGGWQKVQKLVTWKGPIGDEGEAPVMRSWFSHASTSS